LALIDRRIGILFIAFVALLGIALARATYLGSVRAGSLERAAATQQVTDVVVPAARGSITDRDGAELAISESADDIVADPYLITDPISAAAALSPALGVPELKMQSLLTRPHTGFVYLAHLVPETQATEIARMRIAGISLIPEMRRVYPRGREAAQVVGAVHLDGDGASGIELQYNRSLVGRNGMRRIVSDARGQPISIDDVRPAVPGKTVALTIDSGLQQEVEHVLAQVGATYSPKSATAIAVDPSTGAILALANWRGPNADSSAGPDDLAIGLNYEPGSTFKAITVAGALQDRLVTPTTNFDIPPTLSFASNEPPIHDAENHGYETLNVAGILKYSSNIGADLIGQRLGAQRFNYWVHRFGFGSPTGVDLPGEAAGIILSPTKYSGASMYNMPFGQGESVTPMQMIAAYDAIANGGILRAPHVVQSVGGTPVSPSPGRRIISSTTAAELRDMLRGVFADGGTASGAEIPGYDMAGKTGTANIAIDGHYSNSAYVASFIGMVPTDHPRLVVAVVVNQPQGSIYGGSVAAPAFQQIVGWAVPYFGLPPK
jgi:cell division protein FtsI (penicillin-binding protein 3)